MKKTFAAALVATAALTGTNANAGGLFNLGTAGLGSAPGLAAVAAVVAIVVVADNDETVVVTTTGTGN